MGVWKEGENIGILENVVGILTIYVMYNAGESSTEKNRTDLSFCYGHAQRSVRKFHTR